jgi:hypothetical protein
VWAVSRFDPRGALRREEVGGNSERPGGRGAGRGGGWTVRVLPFEVVEPFVVVLFLNDLAREGRAGRGALGGGLKGLVADILGR